MPLTIYHNQKISILSCRWNILDDSPKYDVVKLMELLIRLNQVQASNKNWLSNTDPGLYTCGGGRGGRGPSVHLLGFKQIATLLYRNVANLSLG